MTTIKEQEFNRTAELLQNKSYIDNKAVQEQLFKGLLNYGIFQQMINDQELNRYLYPCLLNLVTQATVNTYKEGKILNLQGQNYNTLYLILSGKVLFYKHKSNQEIDNEMYFIHQEEHNHKEQTRQFEEKYKQLQEEARQGSKNKKGMGQQNKNQGINQNKIHQQMRDFQRKQKPYGDIYSLINNKNDAPKTASSTLKQMQNPEDNMLRNSQQCSSQYYSGPLCLYKVHSTKSTGDYFGEIVNNVKGRAADATAIVSQRSVILQISGIAFYQIFKNIIYQLNFVYQILELSFKGYSRKVLLEIALNSERRDYRQDQCIYAQNSPSTGFYILKEGEVALVHNKKKLKFLKKGQIFGKEDMFYKTRKYEAVSDSNKTVVFEVVKSKVNNYYFLKDVKQKGEQLIKQLQSLVNSEGNQHIHNHNDNHSQIYNSKLNLTFANSNNLTLNKTQMNILGNFMNQRGSIHELKALGLADSVVGHRPSSSMSNYQKPGKSFQQFQTQDSMNINMMNKSNFQMHQSNGSMRSSFQRTNSRMIKSVSNKFFNNKRDSISKDNNNNPSMNNSNNRSGSVGDKNPNVERFAMLRDQDVFNEEDYNEHHYKEIMAIKKVNKIIIDGNRKIFITHPAPQPLRKQKSPPKKKLFTVPNRPKIESKGVQFADRPQSAMTKVQPSLKKSYQQQQQQFSNNFMTSPEDLIKEQQEKAQASKKPLSLTYDQIQQEHKRKEKFQKLQDIQNNLIPHSKKYAIKDQYTQNLNINLDYQYNTQNSNKYILKSNQNSQMYGSPTSTNNKQHLAQLGISPIESCGKLSVQQQDVQKSTMASPSGRSLKFSYIDDDYSTFSKNKILQARKKKEQEQREQENEKRKSQLAEEFLQSQQKL